MHRMDMEVRLIEMYLSNSGTKRRGQDKTLTRKKTKAVEDFFL